MISCKATNASFKFIFTGILYTAATQHTHKAILGSSRQPYARVCRRDIGLLAPAPGLKDPSYEEDSERLS